MQEDSPFNCWGDSKIHSAQISDSSTVNANFNQILQNKKLICVDCEEKITSAVMMKNIVQIVSIVLFIVIILVLIVYIVYIMRIED